MLKTILFTGEKTLALIIVGLMAIFPELCKNYRFVAFYFALIIVNFVLQIIDKYVSGKEYREDLGSMQKQLKEHNDALNSSFNIK